MTRRGALRALSCAALGCAGAVQAQEAPLMKESDPGALGVGYVEDAQRADRRKYPGYRPGQACRGCALFGGEPGQAQGGCQLFIGVEVRAAGWCSAWEALPAS